MTVSLGKQQQISDFLRRVRFFPAFFKGGALNDLRDCGKGLQMKIALVSCAEQKEDRFHLRSGISRKLHPMGSFNDNQFKYVFPIDHQMRNGDIGSEYCAGGFFPADQEVCKDAGLGSQMVACTADFPGERIKIVCFVINDNGGVLDTVVKVV